MQKKCKKEPVSYVELKTKIDLCERYELYYAVQQNKVEKHINKWYKNKSQKETNDIANNCNGQEYIFDYLMQVKHT